MRRNNGHIPENALTNQSARKTPINRDVLATSRVTLALKLRAEKQTYQSIADQCGYGTAQAAHKAVMRELERVVVSNVEQLRAEELEVIDTMHREVWAMFMDKKSKLRLFAVDRLIALSAARRKLMGMDLGDDGVVAGAQVIIREAIPNYFGTPIENAPSPVLPAPTSEVSS